MIQWIISVLWAQWFLHLLHGDRINIIYTNSWVQTCTGGLWDWVNWDHTSHSDPYETQFLMYVFQNTCIYIAVIFSVCGFITESTAPQRTAVNEERFGLDVILFKYLWNDEILYERRLLNKPSRNTNLIQTTRKTLVKEGVWPNLLFKMCLVVFTM